MFIEFEFRRNRWHSLNAFEMISKVISKRSSRKDSKRIAERSQIFESKRISKGFSVILAVCFRLNRLIECLFRVPSESLQSSSRVPSESLTLAFDHRVCQLQVICRVSAGPADCHNACRVMQTLYSNGSTFE